MVLALQSSFVSQAASIPLNTDLTISFIKVDNGGKGDATLIDCKGKYFLVDGGKAGSYSQLTAHLKKRCKKTNDKIVLEGIILTHYHGDHQEGLIKLLGDPEFKVKTIYRNNCALPVGDKITVANSEHYYNMVAKVKDAVKKAGAATQIVSFNNGCTQISANGTTINLYPSAYCTNNPSQEILDSIKAHDAVYVTNNTSIIVQIVNSNKLSALLLGDITTAGLNAAWNKYGGEIFNRKYSVCKVGHHGVRGSDIASVNRECNFYDAHLNNLNVGHYLLSRDAASISTVGTIELSRRLSGSQFDTYRGDVYCYIPSGGLGYKVSQ